MKKSIENILRKLNFTATERKVVLILVGAFLVGLIIRYVQLNYHDGTEFDYTAQDAEYAARAASAAGETGGTGETDDPVPTSASGEGSTDGFLDLNRATKQELMTLPGIGEALAERIIMYRVEHGGFRSVEDLLNVRGIGRRKLEKIISFCSVGGV